MFCVVATGVSFVFWLGFVVVDVVVVVREGSDVNSSSSSSCVDNLLDDTHRKNHDVKIHE